MFKQMRLSLSGLLLLLLISGCGQDSTAEKQWQLTIFDPQTRSTRLLQEVDAKGKRIVINYWAEWCKPCITEIPELNHFATVHSDSVIVLGVNFDKLQGDTLQQALANVNMQFPAITSDLATMFTLPDISGLPTTLVLDEHGNAIQIMMGPQTQASLESALPPAPQTR